MVQGVKVLAPKPDNLSLIPRTYTVEGEKTDFHKVSSNLYLWTVAHDVHCGTHTNTINKQINK